MESKEECTSGLTEQNIIACFSVCLLKDSSRNGCKHIRFTCQYGEEKRHLLKVIINLPVLYEDIKQFTLFCDTGLLLPKSKDSLFQVGS